MLGVSSPNPDTPTPPRPASTWLWAALFLLIVAVYLLRVGHTAQHFSQTVDEPYHVGSAVALYDSPAHILGVQHPPVVRWVIAAPLKFLGAGLPEYAGKPTSLKEDDAYAAGSKVLFSNGAGHYWDQLTLARWAVMVFPAIALLYTFLLGSRLHSPAVGIAAAAVFSLDTTLLGHGMWLCTDAAAAAGFLACLYHGLRWLESPGLRTATLLGIAGGLGVGAKFSVALAAPALILVWLAFRLLIRSNPKPGWKPQLFLHLPVVVLVSLLTLWATYKFHVGPLADSTTLSAAPQWDKLPAVVKNTPIPMPAFPIGLGRLLAHSSQGHGTFMLGEFSERGWWYYFPTLIAAKTPVGLLLLLALGLPLALLRLRSHLALWLILAIPAALFLLASMFGGIQIGVRHILPVLPLLYILACVGLVPLLRRLGPGLVAALALLAAAEGSLVHPHYLAFFNFPARHLSEPRHIATDSNLDWGQDLAELANHPRLGDISAILPLGDRQQPLFDILGLDPATLNAPPKPGSLFAISITRLTFDPKSLPANAKLIDQVGHGILIYQVP
jgi:hypothetical protein